MFKHTARGILRWQMGNCRSFFLFPQNTNDEYLSLNDLINLEISNKI